MEEGTEESSCCLSPEKGAVKRKIWCLKRVGKDHGWLRLLDNTEVTIGRGLNVTHQILSVSCPLMISRNHCTLKQKDDGPWTVTDNESMNGVWVNGTRITPGKPQTMRQGDVVQFGVPLDSNPAEFEYALLHCNPEKIQGFLMKTTGAEANANVSHESKPKKPKRKFGADELEPGKATESQSKLYCTSNTDKSSGLPCPSMALTDQAGTSDPAGIVYHPCDNSQHLASLQRYNNNLRTLKEQMGATQRQAAELEGHMGLNLEPKQKMQALQEQMALLQDELNSQQEMALRRVDLLEQSIHEEKRQLVMKKTQQKEDGLKKQLEEALKEHRRVIEELQQTRKGFKEVLQAKNKELEVTKEEKERARAQKEEVVTQMTEVLENELQCIICSELFIEAVTLSCSHSFCQHCIGDWRSRKDECPICRQPIHSQIRSLVLDNCIDRMVENLSAEMRERRTELIVQRKGERS